MHSEQISFVPKSVYIEDLVERLSREKEMTQTDQCRKLIKEYIAGWVIITELPLKENQHIEVKIYRGLNLKLGSQYSFHNRLKKKEWTA